MKKFINLAGTVGIDPARALRLPFDQALTHVQHMMALANGKAGPAEAKEETTKHRGGGLSSHKRSLPMLGLSPAHP